MIQRGIKSAYHLTFCWPCIIMYYSNVTNLIHFHNHFIVSWSSTCFGRQASIFRRHYTNSFWCELRALLAFGWLQVVGRLAYWSWGLQEALHEPNKPVFPQLVTSQTLQCTQLTPKTASVVPPEDGRLTPETCRGSRHNNWFWKWECINLVTLLWSLSMSYMI
jgi:hypothetical protein